MWYKYTIEYCLAIKKMNETLPFTTTLMHLEGVMLSRIRQTEKDKYVVISLTCGMYYKWL